LNGFLPNLRCSARNNGNISHSQKLIFQAAKDQKIRLLAVFLLGLGSAVLEGLTFGLLAIALELLSSNTGISQERWRLGVLSGFPSYPRVDSL